MRSANLGKSLAVKILMGFFAVYMMVSLLATGFGLYFILEDQMPGQDPLRVFNGFLMYWLAGEIVIRYLMQKIPYMDIRPFLVLPVRKRSLVHFLLLKSAFSFFNFLGLFIFLPFAGVLLAKGYDPLGVCTWLLGLFSLALSVNYTNFLINKNDKIFAGFVLLFLLAGSLEYFGWFPLGDYAGAAFQALYELPVSILIPLGLLEGLYVINYRFLRKQIFLDASLRKRSRTVSSSDLGWTRRFGSLAPFLQLDLRLIWRNKRTKTQVFVSLLMALYGLIFYSMEDFGATSAMLVFVGLFMTGIFLTNFGQFIPAWDSTYYPLMMSQNIPLRQYLESKALLISISVIFMFVLTLPYVYFGWEALAINFASALWNLGVNLPVILFFGSFNKKRIDLSSSPVGNMQGVSATQFLIIIPLIGLPLAIYSVLLWLVNFETALFVLGIFGILGLLFRKSLMALVTRAYAQRKYGMIAGFSQKDS